VDGDAVQDVCFVTDGGELYALSGDGLLIAGYPKSMVSPSISGVGVGDIDGDGLFELVAATWDGWVYAWDTEGPALPGRADWPMRGVNARNTGIYGDPGVSTSVAEGPVFGRSGLRLAANPVIARAEFLIEAGGARATLEIYDPRGRLVDAVAIENAEHLFWKPDPALPAGVYLARLRGDAAAGPLKFVLLR